MGICGLLPYLKHAIVTKSIDSYKNKSVGIDGHSWLYRIATIISQELFYKVPTKKHVYIFQKKVLKLKSHKITPIIIFDGLKLPSKNVTNSQRKEKKEQIHQMIITCLKNNNTFKAHSLMKQCLFITDEIISGILEMLDTEHIEYIISPYESDAQLAYLQRIRYIDYIMTEDSDLILYGCDRILFKYDDYKVEEFLVERFKNMKSNFFTLNMIEICILSGCDYLHSIKGVGLITAHKLMEKYGSYTKVIEFLKSIKDVPDDYEQGFERALITFNEHIVYDPIMKERIHLSGKNILENIEFYEFLGQKDVDDPVGYARGNHIKKSIGPLERFVVKKAPVELKEKTTYSKFIGKKKVKTVINTKLITIYDDNETSFLFENK